MTKLANAFGDEYKKSSASIKVKTFELGGHTFKVRVPLSKEVSEMDARVENIDKAKIEAKYLKISEPFRKLDDKIEGLVITDDDVVVDGRSCRELAKTALQSEQRVLEYVRLLVAENGDMSEITYQDIEDEFPFQVQLEIVAKINEAIQPGYKESRKN